MRDDPSMIAARCMPGWSRRPTANHDYFPAEMSAAPSVTLTGKHGDTDK